MRPQLVVLASILMLGGCTWNSAPKPLSPKAYGAQIAEVSGGKQSAAAGSTLPQPVIIQVNGADGSPVTGALVRFRGEGVEFNPGQALSDSSGQVTTAVQLGFAGGDYQLTAETPKQAGGTNGVNLRETSLGYETTLGEALNNRYCVRCHDSESTPERVSNFDNLSPKPHQFSDGAIYNLLLDSDLLNIISHGGLALGKSAQMPAYGKTLKSAELKAVVAYIRAVADPPYQTSGVKYAK